MDWLLDCLRKAREIVAFADDPIVANAIALMIIWIVVPLTALTYAKRVRRTRRKAERPMSDWDLWAMTTLIAGLAALFVGNRFAEWPLDKAINHAVLLMFVLPLLLPALLNRLEKMAPDLADDIGDLPTAFRGADTTELAPGDVKVFDPNQTTIVRDCGEKP